MEGGGKFVGIIWVVIERIFDFTAAISLHVVFEGGYDSLVGKNLPIR